jgi:hypothetical protein
LACERSTAITTGKEAEKKKPPLDFLHFPSRVLVLPKIDCVSSPLRENKQTNRVAGPVKGRNVA